MTKITGFKRTLSVLLTLVMLVSTMAVAGVSAAVADTAYHYTFDNTTDGFNYNSSYFNGIHNAYNGGSYGAVTQLVSGGYNGSAQAVKMAYTANLTAQEDKWLSAFSLPNNTSAQHEGRNPGQTVYLTADAAYQITVTYKVTGYASAGALYFAQGMGALASSDRALFNQCRPLKIADITATTSDWQTVTVVLGSAIRTGPYIVLKMADDTQRAGTEVLIGAVHVVPVDPSAMVTVSFETNGGGSVSPVTGVAGDPINYPADPTREGYEFLGWFTAGGERNPVNFPTSDTILTAKWLDPSVWSFESEAVGTDIAINSGENMSAVVTDAYRYGGDKALKLTSKNKSAALRPQFNVLDANGEQVIITAGNDYTVSFYVMFPDIATVSNFHYWMTAADDDVPYESGSEKDAEKIAEKNSTYLEASGRWQRVTITVTDAAKSGKLRMGIAGDLGAAHTFYLDDLKVKEIKRTPAETNTWNFETDTVGSTVSVEHFRHDTNKMTVTNEAAHTGRASVRVDSKYTDGNLRSQMILKNAAGETVTVEQGKTYYVSFWVMVPEDQQDATFALWLAATPDGEPFDSGRTVEGVPYVKNNFVLYEVSVENGPAATANGEWVPVSVTLTDVARSGQLRLGIADSSNNTDSHFYIDDVKVRAAGEVITDNFVMQDFEDYANGDKLHINDDPRPTITTTVVTTDEVTAHSGKMTAKFTSNTNNGDIRPQMMVKDANDNQFKVYKGRNYEVKFWVYLPGDSPAYTFSYWLAATPDAKSFNMVDYRKNDYVIAEVSGGVQPEFGRWTEITMTVSDCVKSGLLRIGVTGAISSQHSFYIDDISVRELHNAAEDGVNSFETLDSGEKLSLGTDANVIEVTDAESHNGDRAAQVTTTGNGVNTAPQMTVKNDYDEEISVTAGKQYNVEFWVMVPESEEDYDLQYWLAATDNDAPFSDTNALSGVMANATVVTIAEQGVWQRVSLKVDNCPVSGKLRLGISGTTAAAHKFYLDDMLVEEFTILPADTKAMNFENLALGTDLSLTQFAVSETVRKNWAKVTDEKAYTGTQSLYFHAYTSAGDARPQINVTDAEGNQIKLEQGGDYYISFKVLLSEDVEFSYWAACVPDDKLNEPFQYGTDFIKNTYVVMENSRHVGIYPGEWTEIKVPVMNCKLGGNLRVGFTHYAANNQDFYFYIDDVKIEPPEYVLVKFDTNGAEGDYPDKMLLSGSVIFTEDDIMPYRNGYEFMGWYTNKECTKDAYFDAYATPVVGETGDVLTLYACWREWAGEFGGSTDGNHGEPQYKTEYYTEKVWVGDQNVPDPLDIGARPPRADAEPIVTTPKDDAQPDADGIPPWLIVVIIVGAVVVVGGGAAIAAVMLKKNKKA